MCNKTNYCRNGPLTLVESVYVGGGAGGTTGTHVPFTYCKSTDARTFVAQAFIKRNGDKIEIIVTECLYQFEGWIYTWKVNVICCVSAERTWRRNGNIKVNRYILSIMLTLLQPRRSQLPWQQWKRVVAGIYSGRRSVCDGAWAFCRQATWQPGFPPIIWTPNQLASIANQLVLSFWTSFGNGHCQCIFDSLLVEW